MLLACTSGHGGPRGEACTSARYLVCEHGAREGAPAGALTVTAGSGRCFSTNSPAVEAALMESSRDRKRNPLSVCDAILPGFTLQMEHDDRKAVGGTGVGCVMEDANDLVNA